MATQILFMLVSTTLSSVLPVGRIQKIIGKLSYLISIRILVRSLSVVVNYHDKTNMPKSGICVANHTTVIDVAVLSNNQCFSMVLFSFFFRVVTLLALFRGCLCLFILVPSFSFSYVCFVITNNFNFDNVIVYFSNYITITDGQSYFPILIIYIYLPLKCIFFSVNFDTLDLAQSSQI